MKRWRIDPAEELPLAVIEDDAEGIGVVEIGSHTPNNLDLAQRIVQAHNTDIVAK